MAGTENPLRASVDSAPGQEKKDKTLEEITLEMLEQLGSSVRPARNVPNLEALAFVINQLRSDPPETLDMEWFSVGDPQATELAAALKGNTTVRSLKLRYNEIRDDGAIALAGALEAHDSLETIALGNNMIGNRGAAAVANAVASKGKVTSLDLRYNSMGPTLPEPFAGLTNLSALDIRANRLVSLPAQLGQLTQLKTLVVERNHDLAPAALTSAASTEELLKALREQDTG